MDRPDAAVLGEVRSVGRVPVLGVGDRRAGGEGPLDLGVDDRHDLVAASDRQAAGRIGEVVLDVHDDQRHLRAVPAPRVVDGHAAQAPGSPAACRSSRRSSVDARDVRPRPGPTAFVRACAQLAASQSAGV